MAFDGLLAKLGPTLVREATPHLMQMISGLSDRFRKDTSEIKAAVNAEMASVARTHAALATAVDNQRERLAELQEQCSALSRQLEILQRTVEVSARQAAIETAAAAKSQRATRTLALTAAVLSGLAFGAAILQLVLHR